MSDIFLHLAYVLTALSFAVRDVIWLRALAILASVITLVAKLTIHVPWHDPSVFWNSVFLLINAARVFHMVYGERAARFNDEETELYETLFSGLSRLEFLKLLRAGAWRQAQPGQVLATQNHPLPEVILVSNGTAKVEISGKEVATLKDGQFIGEMSFVTLEPASATVTALEPTRYLAWPKEALRQLLGRNPAMRVGLSHVMSADLSRKLRAGKA